MSWNFVDSTEEFEELAGANCWEDSQVLELYATPRNEDYFPSDVSRSGHRNMNIHMLVDACSGRAPILELVFIDADTSSLHYLMQPFVQGRIDNLKRVYIENHKGELKMRCSRLIYRFVEEEELHFSGSYYATAQQSG